MNKWECSIPGCEASAVGSGGAIGLRAIGWWFLPAAGSWGAQILCPVHRPNATTDHTEFHGSDDPHPCSTCAGENEARKLQQVIIDSSNEIQRAFADLDSYYKRLST